MIVLTAETQSNQDNYTSIVIPAQAGIHKHLVQKSSTSVPAAFNIFGIFHARVHRFPPARE
jgi:hypothetical protein